MMTEIKKCLKICKYGYQLKTNIFTGLFFFVLGLFFLFMGSGINVCLSAAYLLLGPFIVVQVTYVMLFSNIVASASLRKFLDGVFPAMVGIIASLFAYGMTFVGLLVNPKLRVGELADCGNVVIAASIAIAAVLFYYGMSFKIFVVGTILFFFLFMGAIVGCGFLIEGSGSTDLLTGSIIGFLILVAGNVLSCILRATFYKKTVSSFAGGNSLRKALK